MSKKDKVATVIKQINSVLREFEYVDKVAVEIYGKLTYLSEHQVRALQVICKRKANKSPEEWQEFVDNVIVYSGKDKRKSSHKMIFCKDGYFDNEFDGEFYAANWAMSHELMTEYSVV